MIDILDEIEKYTLKPEILIHPHIPKPLHGISPRSIMGKDWWDRERQRVYKSTNFHCAAHVGKLKGEKMNKEEIKRMNPFTDEYMKQEVKFYGIEPYKKGEVVVELTSIDGRCDDYLNKNWRLGSIKMPIMFIGRKLWMSLSFMEVQSHFLPINLAYGYVATGGLGLGYFTLSIAASGTVDKVDVYENNKDVIEYFVDRFKDREGFEKINIIEGDARKKMKGKEYDFVFMDIYETLLPDDVIKDTRLFKKNNNIESYHFWGQEKVILAAKNYGYELDFTYGEQQYFKWWAETKAAQMANLNIDEDFVTKCLKEMER